MHFLKWKWATVSCSIYLYIYRRVSLYRKMRHSKSENEAALCFVTNLKFIVQLVSLFLKELLAG